MLILLLGGALVTKTESGEGCGTSWPLCHGKIIPDEITLELVIEFSHRIVTGIVTILVVLFVVTCKSILVIFGNAIFILFSNRIYYHPKFDRSGQCNLGAISIFLPSILAFH